MIIDSNFGCTETLVRDGENGWTFSPDDEGQLAQRMLDINNLPPETRRDMGARSEVIISEWGLDRFVQGAVAAIEACKNCSRGFKSLVDRAIIGL